MPLTGLLPQISQTLDMSKLSYLLYFLPGFGLDLAVGLITMASLRALPGCLSLRSQSRPGEPANIVYFFC